MKATLTCIILFAEDVDRLKSFYIDNLNLQMIEEIKSEWVLLKAGSCELGLHKIGAEFLKSNETQYKVDTNTKIVFEIDEDIVAFRAQLITKNIVLKEVKTWDNYNYWVCDGEDPEGNIFQLRMKKRTMA